MTKRIIVIINVMIEFKYWCGKFRPYQCLGRNRNTAVSFRSKYRIIPGRIGHSGRNTEYRPKNENRPVKSKKKKKKNRPCGRFYFSGSDATSRIILHLLFVFSFSSSSSFVQTCSPSVFLLSWPISLLTFLAFCFYQIKDLTFC